MDYGSLIYVALQRARTAREAIQVIVDLANEYGTGPVALKSIAERQDISENYLEQLMGTLKKAGFVKSIRGAQGGYILAKEPVDISIGEIIVAMEGPIAFADCMQMDGDAPYVCAKAASCSRRDVWDKIGARINEVLNSITLEEIREKPGK